MTEPFVALMRRYVTDYTNRHDVSVCPEIMEPGYVLHMGPHEVAGRDEAYIPAARRQFEQFPGLGLTVHTIVTDGRRLAMRFSEHGRRARDGRLAVWTGIGLYRWNGRRLESNFVEQDYWSRRRQLGSGHPGTVDPPALAPWDTTAEPAEPAAETVVREWLATGAAVQPASAAVRFDDGDAGPALLTDVSSTVDELFSAGSHVAFRVTASGAYAGGLGSAAGGAAGTPATLHLVGLVTVDHGRVAGGWIVRDRLGLARSLAQPAVASS
ncbi:nuclear transport factor 2 family protein [Amycolatopsis sp. FDAARGOS 1241]|uniref:nuclear transport factor 2 family protein n=1 Tax=Amycolatopsis sp. FDAARGOS 1241 TaxID=2778070 RepID=UPI0019528F50|nr:nuclear transport factor 2 family protein [Amycolatopsis sp. FDAARGOS 1241]QRP43093.1 nuclear transport factor 2 family protein [Amycolatopsis sp. FDAARGOS 1241]